jgi:hypothetical protein
MRPPEVLDRQAALLDHLGSTTYQMWIRQWVHVGRLTGRFDMPAAEAVPEADRQLADIRRSLQLAQAFHVQPEMLPLVRVAAADLDDEDHLSHEVLPAEHGFLMFDQPLLMTDSHGGPAHVQALSWRPGAGGGKAGVWFTAWRDTDLYYRQSRAARLAAGLGPEDPGDVESFERSLGGLCLEQRWFSGYGDPVGPSRGLREEVYARLATEREYLSEEADNITRIAVALFRLLGQTIVEVREDRPDRPTARRATRKHLRPEVRTIRLRRKDYVGDDVGGGGVEWQHSWIVRGHWAWRACGEEHPLAEPYEKGHRARVYIAPYVKGPEGKPLHVSDKVWSLAR